MAEDHVGKLAARDPQKDWRFADPAWKENPFYKRLAQGYLAFCDSVDKVVEDNPDWEEARARRSS